MKLSKNHVVKTAEEQKLVVADEELSGADLDSDEELDMADEALKEIEDEESNELGDEADYFATDEEGEEPLKKYKATLEAATPHANAAKELWLKRRELMDQVNMLDDKLMGHREVLRALDPKMKHESYADDKDLKNFLKPEKVEEKKKKRKKKLDAYAEAEVVDGLLKVATVLDYAGDSEGVSLVENVLRIFAKKDNGMPKYDVQTVEKTERKYPDVAAVAPSLSTRGCPDHNGAQMKRVAEGTFQCELDGRMYNWNEGFKDYSGNVFPGAPIRSVDFPDTTERMFETREMATNKRTK